MNKNTVIAIVATTLFGPSAAAWAGFTFTQTTRTDGQPAAEVKVWTDGRAMRMEYSSVRPGNPFMKPGGYMLMNEQGMLLVDPAERTYARFDPGMFESMMQEMSQATSGAASLFEIRNVRVEKVLDEAGEPILGYPTRHYQFRSSWTMAMTGAPMTTEHSSVEDVWTTEAIAISLGAAAPVFDMQGLPSAAKEAAAADALKDFTGFPLRHVTVQSTKTNMGIAGLGGRMAQRMMNRGAGGDTTTIMEVTGIEEVDVPAGLFELPAGYRETQLFQQGPALPDLNSSGGRQGPPDLNSVR